MLKESTEWKSLYRTGSKKNWHGRSDGTREERYHQVVEIMDLKQGPTFFPNQKTCCFLGFASDEGVKRNRGRPGAVEGPAALREALSNLPVHTNQISNYYDVGDIACESGDLEQAQEGLGQVISHLLKSNSLPVVLGGGHETAWGHYQGIEGAFPKADCAIVNFDAHYDLRPVQKGEGSSGTPFSQIASSRLSQGLNFDYTCLGIQKVGNTPTLFEKAQELKVRTIFADEFHMGNTQHCIDALDKIIDHHERVYVTICLDVFASPYAPGVSAPQPLGLTPWHVIPLLRHLASSGRVVSIDITELSPPLDSEGQTAKLAASLISEFLNNIS